MFNYGSRLFNYGGRSAVLSKQPQMIYARGKIADPGSREEKANEILSIGLYCRLPAATTAFAEPVKQPRVLVGPRGKRRAYDW